VIPQKVRHIFRLDDDLESFTASFAVKTDSSGFEAAVPGGCFVRRRSSKTVVKTMCTTNCSWGLTKKMVAKSCELLGERIEFPIFAFPTAEADG
jgi:N-glycosylase/DNA lyase